MYEGKPIGMLVGFETDGDEFEAWLENQPRFLARIAQARQSFKDGQGMRLEDLTI